MGFFGGMGAGKGWHKFYAVVTPEELSSVLERVACVLVHANPVPAGYTETTRDDYVDAYRKLYESMGATDPAHHTVDSAVRITASLSRDVYSTHPSNLQDIQVIRAERPVVNLAPGTILFDGQLVLGVFGGETTAFGMELTFPKVVFFGDEGMEIPHADAEFENFALFQQLASAVKHLTRPCRIESPVRIHKPRARISDAAKADLTGRSYFSRHKLTIL